MHYYGSTHQSSTYIKNGRTLYSQRRWRKLLVRCVPTSRAHLRWHVMAIQSDPLQQRSGSAAARLPRLPRFHRVRRLREAASDQRGLKLDLLYWLTAVEEVPLDSERWLERYGLPQVHTQKYPSKQHVHNKFMIFLFKRFSCSIFKNNL